MISLAMVYAFAGSLFAAFAVLGAADRSNPRRWTTALFWALLALSMLAGDRLGDLANGVLVLALVAIAGAGGLGRGTAHEVSAATREAGATRFGNGLFVIALAIPATALAGTILAKYAPGLLDARQATLISLAFGVLVALAAGYAWLRPAALMPLQQGRRLLDHVGWAAILPQMLASLGAIFALAGVGGAVGHIVSASLPGAGLTALVLAYALGMVVFTMVMGNAFAAFPVMFAAIGLPLLIRAHHGDPAIVCAVGMLAGFCGTLMTPMAANFNLVPVALLKLKDRYAVIRAQWPTALPLLVFNIVLIRVMAFP
ncbi:DUF979 domain-containing protein [Novosphingobium lentum]|uniref:DUF979 domain-containing protein n=1 Tax=Novosphingobium lentum TaxID=145287 RepID=UPI0008357DCE|nr:DUF979 domain-containing protein [Novosphingobium lentum]